MARLKQGPASVPELAAGFGVSVRTVQRDMEACSNAKFPVVSPKQSFYSFAEGFSLDAVQLSCEEAALLVVSAAIAKQIGGSFGAAQQQVARRFNPPVLPKGCFETAADLAETDLLAQTLLRCIREHGVIRVSLKDNQKNCTLYPYQLLLLENNRYVISVMPKGEICHYALENIKSYSLRSGNGSIFTPIPFADWAVWRYVCRLINGLQIPKETIPAAKTTTAVSQLPAEQATPTMLAAESAPVFPAHGAETAAPTDDSLSAATPARGSETLPPLPKTETTAGESPAPAVSAGPFAFTPAIHAPAGLTAEISSSKKDI